MYTNTLKFLIFSLIVSVSSTVSQSSFGTKESSEKLTVYEDEDDGRSSLVFVFDTTGSMYNDLRQLREGAEMILSTALEESDVISDFVFVPFHDPAVGPATVTKDKEVFKDALSKVHVHGGGDCPERSLTGIQLALNVSRPRSFVFVFTDATAADHRMVGSVLDAVQRKQSQVVFVLTGHCNDLHRPHYKVYQQIAAASSGQVFNLNKTNVYKVLDFVKSSIRGRTVNLGAAVNPPGYNYTQGIPVDSNLGEVTVSVSGAQPSIKVVNPSGEEVTPPQLVTTLDLAEIMVVKVLQPEAGNWTITTGSVQDHSVRVVGKSNLTFDHGFSVEPPATMAETSYRPLQGTYNHLMLSLTQTDRPVQINYVEILSLEGKTLFEIPLKEVDSERKIYLADAFIPPDDMFYIAINGRDEHNQELRRIGATAVQSKPPDVPYLTVPRKVEARSHESVILTCHIDSLVPITATWTKDHVQIQPKISSLQSTSIQYVINDMSEEDVGTYRCAVQNIAGIRSAATDVTLIVDPPRVTISPANQTLEESDSITIVCTVLSDALLLKYQLIFSGTYNQKVIDINMEPNIEGLYVFNKIIYSASDRDSGVYSCVAANRGGEKSTSTHIRIQSNPTAQILGPHTLTKLIHSHIQLVCHVENADKIMWTNPNGTIVRDLEVKASYTDMFDVSDVSDDGVWTCMAVRRNNNATDSVEISVLIKPEVYMEGPKNISIINGTKIDISCNIAAKPTPRILWHRETEDFLNNTITVIAPNIYKSVLSLDSSKENVKGTYFCFGENSEGIHQDSVTVTVRTPMVLVEGFQENSVELYSQIVLPCHIESYPPPTLLWYHNGTELTVNDNLYLSENNNTLYILKLDFRDLGSYSCEADNGFEKMKIEGSLNVVGLEIPELSKEPVRRITQKEKSTIFTCRVTKGNPQPALTWQYKPDDSDLFTTLPRGVIANIDDSELIISNVGTGHSGTYRCIAENVLGKDVYDVILVVQYPPEIKKCSDLEGKPQIVESGRKVTFSCEASGLPPPIVIWSKDYQPVGYSKNVYLTNSSDLVIEKATEYNSGLFTCNVTSVLGSTQRNFTLIVYAPPKILPPNIDPEVQVLEGDLVELPCKAQGVPKPSIVWLHNGDIVQDDRKYIDEFGLRFVANLTDFGKYSCVAQNEYGNASFTFFIYVWVPPYIEPLQSSVDILIGTNASLECNVIGFPLPIVSWQFEGGIIKNSTDLSFNEFGNLYITNASATHNGVYSCLAENIAGIDKKSTNIIVNEPPKILQDNFTGPYIATTQDSKLVISCRTTGNPRPFVVWSIDDRYIYKDSRYEVDVDGTLTIKQLTEDMCGSYVCIAKNKVGTANKTVQVEVYSSALPARLQADESQTSVTMLEGDNATIDCPIRTSDKDIVKWYKDAKLISTNLFKIYNISRHNASTYACVVTNAVGSNYANVKVIVEWPPSFIENWGDSTEVVRGDDHYFDCEVDAKPAAKIKWLFNWKPVLGEDKPRLKLMNIALRHTGTYKCIVSNTHATVTKQFTLHVLVPPFISDFDLLDVQLKRGMNATLECNARGSPTPTIKWTYNNKNWHPENDTLTAYNISDQSEGLYRCDATNKAGAAHIVYRVSVASPATIEEIVLYREGKEGGDTVTENIDAVLNTSVRLSCKALGKPQPTVQWIRNGNVLSQNMEDIGYADLKLDKIGVKNNGVYTCMVSNEGGMVERTVNVDVFEPPKIFQNVLQDSNEHETKLEVLSGQAFYLHCHPYGNPLPEVYWFKNDLPLRLFDDTMISTDYGEVIVSSGARVEQSGNYTCVARNKVGNASTVYLVDVLVPPPAPKESSKSISTKLGKQLTLTCPVEGTPLPDVMWIKHPYTDLGELPRITFTDDNVTMIINKTEISDSGKYFCIMTNKVGTTEVVFDVTVEKPASIAGNVGGNIVESHIVPLRRSIVLKCQADGHPPPKISWLKDTQHLSNSVSNIHSVLGNSLLAIWSASTRDAGQYICIAENSAATAHRRYNIAVQVPGKWKSWSVWSYCNVTCGQGYQHRSRFCHYTDDYNVTYDKSTKSDKIILDESGCKGSVNDRRKCHMPLCEEDDSPRWSVWSKWSPCGVTCGAGTQTRTRRCRGKARCGGDNVQEEDSRRWSVWSKWSSCGVTCGAGTQTRTRRCRGKGRCVGDNVQIRKCPDLPKCAGDSEQPAPSVNEVFDSKEDGFDKSAFIPAATFEIQPEIISPPYQTDVEEFYIKTADKYSPVVYDVNVTDNLDGSSRGSCDPGYRQIDDTGACQDIDECLIETNMCHSTNICINTPGGYRCTCPKGFMALGVTHRCIDINECEQEISGCEFACVNTAGGYVCACPAHMRLQADRHSCAAVSSYRQQNLHEELHSEEYLSTNIELPARYLKNKN